MKYSFSLLLIISTATCLAQTSRINFKASQFYPEGVAYNSKANEFFVGSVRTGTISTVKENGSFKEFYKDSSLMSSFGMKVDTKNNLLWVCTGDPNYSVYSTPATHKKMIRLVALDLSSGNKKKDINLSDLYPGNHFANDLSLDDAGNIYVTDSYSPVIYKVDATDHATVLAENALFKSAQIGLNGIAWFPKGYLIVVNNGNGAVIKVDLKTMAVSKVRISQFFPGADGILRSGDDNLVLVTNKGIDKVFNLSSNDDWKTAKVMEATAAEDRFQNPSTVTMQGNKIYVVNAKLNELSDASKKPSDEFSLQLVSFRPVN